MTATKERPIHFSAPMVRAILAGKKTQTRRVIKPQPKSPHLGYIKVEGGALQCGPDYPDGDDDFVKCPYGKPGDELWVRESFYATDQYNPRVPAAGTLLYAVDENKSQLFQRRPSIHMPRWASRITLRVTGVRAERVQDITETDAYREGCTDPIWPRGEFRSLWDSINGKKHPWESNPWVWVIEFEKVKP